MTEKLEIEFRVYRTREPGGKRDCIATRSVPHALQAWNASVGDFDRRLELVISGDWLMRLIKENSDGITEFDDQERARVLQLCLAALASDDETQKERCLEEVVEALGYDLNP